MAQPLIPEEEAISPQRRGAAEPVAEKSEESAEEAEQRATKVRGKEIGSGEGVSASKIDFEAPEFGDYRSPMKLMTTWVCASTGVPFRMVGL